MFKNNHNCQIDRIFDEIKEICLRDSNCDEIKDNENIYLFKPGIVSLLKNKFSNVDKDITLPKPNGFVIGRGFKVKTQQELEKLERNNEEIPCKNIVSDTRRVFEYIVPKEVCKEELHNDKEINYINLPVKSKVTKYDLTDNVKLSKPMSAQSSYINTNNHNQEKQKSYELMSNKSRSFIFNANDFKTEKIKDNNISILNQNSNYFEVYPSKIENSLLKSILKVNTQKHNTTRSIRFANSNLLITVHVYERGYPTAEEEIASKKREDNESEYNSTDLTKVVINGGSSINCERDVEKVMDFKSDMLF